MHLNFLFLFLLAGEAVSGSFFFYVANFQMSLARKLTLFPPTVQLPVVQPKRVHAD